MNAPAPLLAPGESSRPRWAQGRARPRANGRRSIAPHDSVTPMRLSYRPGASVLAGTVLALAACSGADFSAPHGDRQRVLAILQLESSTPLASSLNDRALDSTVAWFPPIAEGHTRLLVPAEVIEVRDTVRAGEVVSVVVNSIGENGATRPWSPPTTGTRGRPSARSCGPTGCGTRSPPPSLARGSASCARTGAACEPATPRSRYRSWRSARWWSFPEPGGDPNDCRVRSRRALRVRRARECRPGGWRRRLESRCSRRSHPGG